MTFPVRGLSLDVIRALDAAAAAMGTSRNGYIVQILTEHTRRSRPAVTAEGFAEAADLARDLGDADLFRTAWS